MRVLVVGKAKTGTTALVQLIRAALEPCRLVMEPKSVLDFGASSIEHSGNEAIKILYEHFRGRWRHMDAIVHAEFGFPVDRAVFIVRDVRDEMVSKLLYHAKIARDDGLLGERAEEKLRAWISVLAQKERRPTEISFRELCSRFHEICGVDLWSRITDLAERQQYERYVHEGVSRDRLVIAYEDMVRGEVSALAEYLGVTVQPDVASVDLGQFGHTRRSGRAGNWRSFFTEEDVTILRPMVKAWLDSDRYDDWDLRPAEHLDPEECSGYVERIALR